MKMKKMKEKLRMKTKNDGLNSGSERFKLKVKSHEDENKVLKFENANLLQASNDQTSDNKINKELKSNIKNDSNQFLSNQLNIIRKSEQKFRLIEECNQNEYYFKSSP